MKNMTMGGMDHTSMDHHSTDRHPTQHVSYFHFSAHATILFAEWTTTTWGEMVGSCIGVAVLAILFEGLRVLREFMDVKYKCQKDNLSCGQVPVRESSDSSYSVKSLSTTNNCKVDAHQPHGMLRPVHWLQTLLHFIQLWISLSLMLVFMTFNVYLCLAVTVGGAIGYFLFAWIQRPGRCYGSDMCH